MSSFVLYSYSYTKNKHSQTITYTYKLLKVKNYNILNSEMYIPQNTVWKDTLNIYTKFDVLAQGLLSIAWYRNVLLFTKRLQMMK